jgi:hypothetical protein
MAQMFDTLLYHLQRLGRAGGVGALLIAAALFVEAGLVRPMQAERAALAESNEQLRLARMAQNRAADVDREQQSMPLSPAAEAALRQLFQAAEDEGLNLDQGDYKFIDDSGTGHRRYQLTLPVIGPYPAIRAFLARSLNDDHALALNAVELRREVIEDTDLDAVLRFTLYLGPDA